MDVVDEKPKNEPRPTGIGPGERLQAARIQQGLSLEDVASRMHLSANILEAIEDNNFEEITAPIFVKGYLRAYARIVSLNEDEMIEQYSDFYSGEDPPITSTSNMVPELSVGDARIKWTTYLVILILGALLAAWWWNKEQNDDASISLESQTSSPEQPVVIDTETASTEIEAVSEKLIESSEVVKPELQESDATEVTEAIEIEAADTVAMQEQEPAATSDETQQPETMTEETQLPEAMTEETAELVDTGPTRIAPAGTDKLQLIVIADTWADIKDGSDYQLVYDLLRADEVVDLMGQAPFTVFLGNGHGIEILFNGEEIDISRRIRDDNTARLKIGG